MDNKNVNVNEVKEEKEVKSPVVDIANYSVRTPGGYLDKEEREKKDDLITLKV